MFCTGLHLASPPTPPPHLVRSIEKGPFTTYGDTVTVWRLRDGILKPDSKGETLAGHLLVEQLQAVSQPLYAVVSSSLKWNRCLLGLSCRLHAQVTGKALRAMSAIP